MKKRVTLIVAIGIIAMAGPTSAADQNDAAEKELCILLARDCATKVYGLQDKIKDLQHEIAKGETVYKAEELQNLKKKLGEAEDMLYKLMPSHKVAK